MLYASLSAIRQLPLVISYYLMKPCYPLTYRKLQNFQTTVLDGKNWENVETLLKDLLVTLQNCAVIGHTRLAGINFRDWRSTVSHSVTKIAPKSPVLCVTKALSSTYPVLFVATQKLFRVVRTVNQA